MSVKMSSVVKKILSKSKAREVKFISLSPCVERLLRRRVLVNPNPIRREFRQTFCYGES